MRKFNFVFFAAAFVVFAYLILSCRASGAEDERLGIPAGFFRITVLEGATGKLIAPGAAAPGDTVQFSITAGFFAEDIVITFLENEYDSDSGESWAFERTDAEGEVYAFIMPEGDVTIDGTFTSTANNDASLSNLSCLEGNLVNPSTSNPFNPSVLSYIVEVAHDVEEVHITWAVQYFGSYAVLSGTTTGLIEGSNNAQISVSAQAGNSQTYTIEIIRKPNLNILSIKFEGPAGSPFNGADAIVINNPAETITPQFSYYAASPIDISISVTRADNTAALAGSPSEFSGISSGTTNISLSNDAPTTTGTITVQKQVSGIQYTKDYTLNLLRPADPQHPASAMAEGGEVQFIGSNGQYDEVHIFRTSGVLTVSRAPTGQTKTFLVAGGGGGGKAGDASHTSSGGGAGGVIIKTNLSLAVGTYNISVGAGAPGGTVISEHGVVTTAANGGNTTLSGPGITTLTAYGGGAGGSHTSSKGGAGKEGGSSGGGYDPPQAAKNVSPIQGSAGGGHGNGGAAGGGGYKGAGQATGNGGTGINASDAALSPILSGVSGLPAVGFAGGGAGGKNENRSSHGGGQRFIFGTDYSGGAGLANTGGGGSGSINTDGKPGGSGIIVLRFQYTAP